MGITEKLSDLVSRYTNFVLEEADLLICVGARFDDRAIGKATQFCPNRNNFV